MLISFVIPVSYKNNFIYYRVKQIIENFKNTEYEVIIADASKKKLIQSDYSNIKIIHLDYQKIFSPAIARNEAIKHASGKYIMFYDVDMAIDENFFVKLENKITNELEYGNKQFILLPFLYLSKKGTKEFEKNKNLEILKISYLKGSNELVESISLNSSAMVIKKSYLESVGLFNTEFKGHGGEDFELIHRLVANNPHSKKPDDYYINETSNTIANLKGFRKYMAYYTLPLFFEDLILIHRWHDRPLFSKFYFKKSKNQTQLIKLMQKYDRENSVWYEQKEALNFNDFIKILLQKHSYDLNVYNGMFKINRKNKSLKNKIRKLITNPKKFIQDWALLS